MAVSGHYSCTALSPCSTARPWVVYSAAALMSALNCACRARRVGGGEGDAARAVVARFASGWSFFDFFFFIWGAPASDCSMARFFFFFFSGSPVVGSTVDLRSFFRRSRFVSAGAGATSGARSGSDSETWLPAGAGATAVTPETGAPELTPEDDAGPRNLILTGAPGRVGVMTSAAGRDVCAGVADSPTAGEMMAADSGTSSVSNGGGF